MTGKNGATLIEILLVPQVKDTNWTEEQKKNQLEKKHGDDTFKPVSYTQDYKTDKVVETSGDKCYDLYKTVNKNQYKELAVKSTNDYEYERQQEECTFKPKIFTLAEEQQQEYQTIH